MNTLNDTTDIICYSRRNCPMDRPVLLVLHAAQAGVDYMDITQDDDARLRVKDINNGNESVPTLVFPDGSTLTEPGPRQLHAKLQDMGYDVSTFAAWRPYVMATLGNPLILLAVAAVAVIIRIALNALGVL